MENKKWKIVPGTSDIEVSNFGDVRSTGGFVFAPVVQKGYAKVGLIIDGKRKQVQIHRLVAEAFVANPFNKTQVNHKNGDTLNNCVWNLEWVTPYENQMHKIYVLGKGMSGDKNPMFGKTGKNNPKFKEYIIASDSEGVIKGRYETQTQAATELLKKYSKAHAISRCLNKKGPKTVGSYYWFYESEYNRMTLAGLKPRELLEHPELWGVHYKGQSAAKPQKSVESSETIENIGTNSE